MGVPSKFKNDLTLAHYMLPGFGQMAFSDRQMLLPHSAVHVIHRPVEGLKCKTRRERSLCLWSSSLAMSAAMRASSSRGGRPVTITQI